jgi:hypothetical protein
LTKKTSKKRIRIRIKIRIKIKIKIIMFEDFKSLDISNSEYQKIQELWDSKNIDKPDDLSRSYKCPKVNIDCRKQKKDREQFELQDKIYKRQERYERHADKFDKEGKVIIPQRGNYFDVVSKLFDYGYNEEKEQELKRHHENYNRIFAEKKDVIERVNIIKEKDKSPLYREDNENYLVQLEKKELRKLEVYPRMEYEIKKIKEKIENEDKKSKKSMSDLIKIKYQKFGSLS